MMKRRNRRMVLKEMRKRSKLRRALGAVVPQIETIPRMNGKQNFSTFAMRLLLSSLVVVMSLIYAILPSVKPTNTTEKKCSAARAPPTNSPISAVYSTNGPFLRNHSPSTHALYALRCFTEVRTYLRLRTTRTQSQRNQCGTSTIKKLLN